MVKAVTIFLILIAVLAMFGRLGWVLRRLGIDPRAGRLSRKGTRSCDRCGRYIIGKGDCDCRVPPGGQG